MIDASSIDTGVADRDAHLKSADFFDVAQFPEITFKATRVSAHGKRPAPPRRGPDDQGHDARGRPRRRAARAAKDPWGNQRAAFTAKTAIDRKDFGLTWNQVLETGGVMVGDRIEIEIEIEAVRQAATKVA